MSTCVLRLLRLLLVNFGPKYQSHTVLQSNIGLPEHLFSGGGEALSAPNVAVVSEWKSDIFALSVYLRKLFVLFAHAALPWSQNQNA